MYLNGRLSNITQKLTRRFFSTATILLYHRIAKVASDPQLLCVSPEHFAEHLEILQRYFYPIGFQPLMQKLGVGDLRKRLVALTFDDGYADNLYNGQPLLDQYSIPATIYVTTGHIGSQRMNWWDELDRLVLQPEMLPNKLELRVGGRICQWESGLNENSDSKSHRRYYAWNVLAKNDPDPRQSLYRSLCQLIRPLNSKERQIVLGELAVWAKVDEVDHSDSYTLSASEVQRLDAGGLIEIGAHTVNHPVLSAIPPGDQQSEIEGSKKYLEEIVGHPIASFAYPYGTRSDYTKETVSIVREMGFANACSNFAGPVWRGSDRFQLPRFVVRDWDGDEFAARLEGWLRG